MRRHDRLIVVFSIAVLPRERKPQPSGSSKGRRRRPSFWSTESACASSAVMGTLRHVPLFGAPYSRRDIDRRMTICRRLKSMSLHFVADEVSGIHGCRLSAEFAIRPQSDRNLLSGLTNEKNKAVSRSRICTMSDPNCTPRRCNSETRALLLNLALRNAPRLCRPCRDRVLEPITLGSREDTTSACIGDLWTSWLLREKSTVPDSRRWSFVTAPAVRCHHMDAGNLVGRPRN